MTRILIIEDDLPVLRGLADSLRLEDYDVIEAVNGESGLDAVEEHAPSLIILDLILPGIDGYEVCRRLRRGGNQALILMLTAKGEEAQKVTGLEIGADDYVTKPFSLLELLARIKALLRRGRPVEKPVEKISFSDVEINFGTFRATRAGKPLEMSVREFELLRYLWQNRLSPLSREKILGAVWDEGYDGTARTVDNFITRLRQKIEPDPRVPIYIQTVRGIGYCFVVDESVSG
jgi:two-component system alkaline phosphatase synthesis response regulator PhoP